jgi:Paraquat-inducible protein A
MKSTKTIILSITCVILGFAILKAFEISKAQKAIDEMKYEYAELNKINYGLFNMQAWKYKAFDVFSGHIEKFNVSPSAYKEAEAELRKYLYSVYDKYIATGELFNKIFEDAEKNSKMNKVILKMFKDNVKTQVELMDIKGHIPQMAKQLSLELKNNEPKFRELMQKELINLMQFKDKYTYTDPRIAAFAKYKCNDIECANKSITEALSTREAVQKDNIIFLVGLLLFALILNTLFYKSIGAKIWVAITTIFSLVLLALGISMPMITIDARMNSFVFNLFERDLDFGEQVVFYQSKSILGVTQNLLESKGLDLKIVGVMILCFSVVFPLIKLVLSALFLQISKLRNSSLAKGMIFYLGKWSMADVFVVALFMAYIGFYGLFGVQLEQLERNKGGFAIETVNYTALASGAYFFTSYCILSIILGIVVNKWHEKENL